MSARRTNPSAPNGASASEVDQEIAFHFRMTIDDLMRSGWSRERAEREAHRRFGDLTAYRRRLVRIDRSTHRRRAAVSVFTGLREDLAYAWRTARRTPAVTIAVALTVALGVGANATMYGVIDRILLSAPPHIDRPDEVKRLYVQRTFLGRQNTSAYITFPDYRDWLASESFEAVAALATSDLTLGSGPDAERLSAVFATASLFPLLRTVPHRGRFFDAADDVAGAPPVAVLGYEVWRRRFGAREDVIGRRLDLGPHRVEVVGVAPPGFTGVDLNRVDVWLPIHSDESVNRWQDSRGYYWIHAIARMRTDATPAAAAAEATALHRQGRADDTRYDAEASVVVAPMMTARGPQASDESVVARWLAGVSIFVLVIACANVANLLLAQGARRRREIAVRLALGVSRWRLVRQLLVGSIVLALLGAVGALAIARIGGVVVGSVLLPRVDWTGGIVSGRVLLFSLVVATLAGLVAGLVPALQSSRADLLSGLKEASAGGVARRSRTRVALLVTQAALSTLLLIGAGLFVRSLSKVRALDLGIEPTGLYVVRLETEPDAVDSEGRRALHAAARSRVEALPFISRVSTVSAVPFRNSMSVGLRAQGLDSIPRLSSGGPYIQSASPDYFDTVGLTVLRGRGFAPSDAEGAPRVAVVGASMARWLWPGDDALGKCLYIGRDAEGCTEIVGVAEDARRQEVIEEIQLLYYVPESQGQFAPSGLLVRSDIEPTTLIDAVQREAFATDPAVRYVTVNAFEDFVAPQLRSWRLGAIVLSAFGGLALVVGAVGLYSVLSFEVAQRRTEIGVRAALGASGGRLVRWVVRGGLRMAGLGVALGLLAAAFATGAIEALLFETSPRDPLTYTVVASTLMVVAVVASLLPALRTTRVGPGEALRAE